MATLVIKNIGKIVSGDIDKPVLEGSVIVINDNLIEAIGGEELLANIGDAQVVDANGTTSPRACGTPMCTCPPRMATASVRRRSASLRVRKTAA